MTEDLLLGWGWRGIEVPPILFRSGGGALGGFRGNALGGVEVLERVAGNAFVWRQGRAEVTLGRDGNAWSVVCTSTGKLLGPRQVTYEARHRRAKHAAWDVMARVIRICHDEEEGVRIGRSAAQWMKDAGIPDEMDD